MKNLNSLVRLGLLVTSLALLDCSGGGNGSAPTPSGVASTTPTQTTPTTPTQSTPSFISLSFLKAVTGNLHTDAVAMDGPPLAGANTLIEATLSGLVQTPTFTIINQDGTVIGTANLSLSGSSSVQPLDFAGTITVPAVPFALVAAGTTADGQTFSLRSPTPPNFITPMNMKISFSPSHALIVRGASTSTVLQIYNGGLDATFSVHFDDPFQLLGSSQDAMRQIAQGQALSLPVTISFPSALRGTVMPTVRATASVSGDSSRLGSSSFTAWLDGAP